MMTMLVQWYDNTDSDGNDEDDDYDDASNWWYGINDSDGNDEDDDNDDDAGSNDVMVIWQ